MCQNSDSYKLLNEIRFKILNSLYERYTLAISIASNNSSKPSYANAKVNELDTILEEIEKYPISWSYYNSQPIKFSQDFENLIIFYEMQNI